MSGGDQSGWETICFRVPPHEKGLLLRIAEEQSAKAGRRVSMSEVLRYLVRTALRQHGVPDASPAGEVQDEATWQTFFCAEALSFLINKPNIVRQMRAQALKKLEHLKRRDPCSR